MSPQWQLTAPTTTTWLVAGQLITLTGSKTHNGQLVGSCIKKGPTQKRKSPVREARRLRLIEMKTQDGDGLTDRGLVWSWRAGTSNTRSGGRAIIVVQEGTNKSNAAAGGILARVLEPGRVSGLILAKMESHFVLITEGGVVGSDQFRDQPRSGEGEGDEENCHHGGEKSSRSTKSIRPQYSPALTATGPQTAASAWAGIQMRKMHLAELVLKEIFLCRLSPMEVEVDHLIDSTEGMPEKVRLGVDWTS